MIRSTLFISAALAVVSVVLTSLWIGYGPRPQVAQEKRASTVAPLSQQERTGLDAKGQPIRTITPGSTSSSGMVETVPTGSAPYATAPTDQPPTPKAPVEPDAPVAQRESASNPNGRTDSTQGAANDPSAATGGSIDLNTASVEQLNGLGAGMIGKRIIEFRPYTSPDELLTRRVLKRSDYESIKAAVTVR
ncbi:helix-hairpin-helix domain-containing protein [Methylobacterium sp. WL7]|nr:helix-hairpin-helix domain-containing protein [Methylobacterium sp. WL7]